MSALTRLGALLTVAMGLGAGFLVFSPHFLESDSPPNTADPFELGQYYFNHGDKADGAYDLKKAREYFEIAIEEDPAAHSLLWYQLGRIDFLEGRFNAAIYKFEKQIEYFKDEVPNVYYMLGLSHGYLARETLDSKEWKQAERFFQTYLGYDPRSPWAHVDLAWAYFSQGKFETMKAVMNEAIQYHPDNPWVLNMYGLALLNTGERAQAREAFLEAQAEAEELTPETWGKVYPGNDPELWEVGLEEFKSLIEANLALVQN